MCLDFVEAWCCVLLMLCFFFDVFKCRGCSVFSCFYSGPGILNNNRLVITSLSPTGTALPCPLFQRIWHSIHTMYHLQIIPITPLHFETLLNKIEHIPFAPMCDITWQIHKQIVWTRTSNSSTSLDCLCLSIDWQTWPEFSLAVCVAECDGTLVRKCWIDALLVYFCPRSWNSFRFFIQNPLISCQFESTMSN